MKMIKKSEFKNHVVHRASFWMFNAANAICVFTILSTALCCLVNANKSVALGLSIYAIMQAMFGLVVNILFHKPAKDKEV
jgi:hypothetical protein